ncbi:MAG: YifB family Mg chelatase-like AAA ATPase [Pseudomonadota bacterium]|nr:YifB family Mg chelatase-like AAA ATPase [Pseudomonadota bacterium]
MVSPITFTRGQLGIEAPLVTVETHLTKGLPKFNIVGLPETAVRESKERVRSAIMNSCFRFPSGRITINLAPADLPKGGGRFDLAIALGILAASRQLPREVLGEYEFAGELGLSGEIRPVTGILASAIAARQQGRKLVVALQNADEAVLPGNVDVYAASDLLTLHQHLSRRVPIELHTAPEVVPTLGSYPDLREVCGQAYAKRALTIAAAGRHSLLMVGPPGTGKSLLSNCLQGLLPELTVEEGLEVAAIYSLAKGEVSAKTWRQRPYCAPHHGSSAAALVGGGRLAMPGMISLAHHGVLFLDELPEFPRDVIEALREPLESGAITVARAARHERYPARFQLIAAMNPCPCGYATDPRHECACTATQIQRYLRKLSGPLLDRIDLQVHVSPVAITSLSNHRPELEKSSADVRAEIGPVLARQQSRQGCTNSALTSKALAEYCPLEPGAAALLERCALQMKLSARSYHRVLRVARTIADLADSKRLEQSHISEALSYRAKATVLNEIDIETQH